MPTQRNDPAALRFMNSLLSGLRAAATAATLRGLTRVSARVFSSAQIPSEASIWRSRWRANGETHFNWSALASWKKISWRASRRMSVTTYAPQRSAAR